MEKVEIDWNELRDMIDISINDEGMHDLLSQLKTYYLLKRSLDSSSIAQSSSYTSVCTSYSGGGRYANTMYINTSSKSMHISIKVESTADQDVTMIDGHSSYMTLKLMSYKPVNVSSVVFPGETYGISTNLSPSTLIIHHWDEVVQ